MRPPWRSAIRRRARGLGRSEILVTSAAIAGFTRLDKITLDEWNRYLAVNLTGTFLCLRAALPDMVAAGWGRIVTISSAAGSRAHPGQGHYSATKGGVIALTKTVARDYAAKGITANTVPPFAIDTPMLREQQAAGKAAAGRVPDQGDSGGARSGGRGRRRGVHVPVLGGGRLRHRPGDRRQRRRSSLVEMDDPEHRYYRTAP